MGRNTYVSRRMRRSRLITIFVLIALGIAVFLRFSSLDDPLWDRLNPKKTNAVVSEDGNAEFYFLDVGQGDSALIRTPSGVVLIDASTNASEDDLQVHLDYLGIKTIDYAIFTHPDADHIGGADMIMKKFDVKHVIMSGHVSTTKTYERLLDAIEESEADVTVPEPGQIFTLGGLTMEILAPLADYKDSNENSIVLRATYGNTSVMFTGDAEKKSEKDMVAQYALSGKLDCDLLKVGHHGSSSSSTEAFVRAVSPTYAVISCGEYNEYGHPHQETLVLLEREGVSVSRTDREGTVCFISDGTTLTKS